MDDQMNKAGVPVAVTVAIALVAALAGFGITKAIDKSDNDAAMMVKTPVAVAPSAGTKAADLRAALVNLGVEHMQLTDQAVDAALDGSGNATAVKAQLISNGESISAAVGSIYGAGAQAKFQELWNIHLTEFVNYAVAGKKGDAAGKAAALENIRTKYTLPISALLSGANPNLPNSALVTAFSDHVTMTAGVIDDHVTGNYAKEMSDLHMANQHIGVLMSTLAGGIVTQYPAKF